jgi:hypothetical protein
MKAAKVRTRPLTAQEEYLCRLNRKKGEKHSDHHQYRARRRSHLSVSESLFAWPKQGSDKE